MKRAILLILGVLFPVAVAGVLIALSLQKPTPVPVVSATTHSQKTEPAPNTARPKPQPQPTALQYLEFLDSYKFPHEAAGSSTGYAPGAIVIRKVKGEKVFLLDSHVYSHGALWAGIIKGDRVECVATIGRPYGKLVPAEGGWNVTGLMCHQDKLYWSYGKDYNTNRRTESFIGITQFRPDSWEIESTERHPAVPQGNLWARGGITRTSDGTILVGFGGYYSIIANGSFGPCLVDGKGRAWLGYPSEHKAPRPNDYIPLTGDSVWLAEKGGVWTGADEIGGENCSSFCLWLGDKVLFSTYQGTGRIGYDSGTITAASHVNRIYEYAAADLHTVRDGQLKSWEPVPKIVDFPAPPGSTPHARLAGGVHDPETGEVWMVWLSATKGEVECYPLLARYHFRQETK